MSQLQLQYLFRDRPCPAGMEAADYELLDIVSGSCHLYGQVMWPDGGVCGPRPCVVQFCAAEG